MRTSVKTLHYPSAGLDRSLSFRSATEPSDNRVYATPCALNVRGTDVFGRRFRGGSRPAFTSVGVGQDQSAEVYDKPTAFYRGRKIYAEGALWYASRAGDLTVFDYGGDGEDPTRAAMGKVGDVVRNDAATITAVFSVDSSAIYISTANTLWVCRDDVTTGTFVRAIPFAGAVSKDAWTFDGQRFYIVSANGVYAYTPGEGASRISTSIPEELCGMTQALCQYDPKYNAIHIFSDAGDWYFELDAKAWWPQSFHDEHRPVLGCVFGRKPRFYCKDGVWREFDEDTTIDDEDHPIESKVVIGPIRCASREDGDGLFDKFTSALAKESGVVAVELYVGKTAEDAVTAAEESRAMAWHESIIGGYSRSCYPRVRGAWVCVRFVSTAPWAFESMTAVTKALGGLR